MSVYFKLTVTLTISLLFWNKWFQLQSNICRFDLIPTERLDIRLQYSFPWQHVEEALGNQRRSRPIEQFTANSTNSINTLLLLDYYLRRVQFIYITLINTKTFSSLYEGTYWNGFFVLWVCFFIPLILSSHTALEKLLKLAQRIL